MSMDWARRNLSTICQITGAVIGALGLIIQVVLLAVIGHPLDPLACTICTGLLLGGPYLVINRIGQPQMPTQEPEK